MSNHDPQGDGPEFLDCICSSETESVLKIRFLAPFLIRVVSYAPSDARYSAQNIPRKNWQGTPLADARVNQGDQRYAYTEFSEVVDASRRSSHRRRRQVLRRGYHPLGWHLR